MFFRTVPVFDVSQPGPLTPPARPIEGDSHAYLIAPLEEHARQLCYGVHVYKLPEHGAGGGVGPGRRWDPEYCEILCAITGLKGWRPHPGFPRSAGTYVALSRRSRARAG